MKRIIALLLCVACLFTVISCGSAYPPVESTEEEQRTVMTLTLEGKSYEVKYELYRAFALMYRDEMAEGVSDPWSDDALVDALHARVCEQIYEIYATLALCETVGIDLYDKETDDTVEEYIRLSIEGDDYFEGLGSYDAYLAALKEDYLNYAVADLLYRYSIGQDALYTYYMGTYDYITDTYKDSALTVTDEKVNVFYAADDTARVMLIYLSHQVYSDAEARLTRSTLLAELGDGGEAAMADWLLRHTATSEQITRGEILSPYTLDDLVYADVTEAALALGVGEMSELIPVSGDDVYGYSLVYRMDKPASYLEDNRSDVRDTYLLHEIGKIFSSTKDALRDSRTDAPLLATLDIATMSMD